MHDPSALADFSDLELISLTRSGDERAYAVLWNRHRSAGIRAARSITAKFDPEDMLQEAFVRILSTLKGDGGPKEAFRPYLYSVLRSISMSWAPSGVTTTPLENLYADSEPSYEFEGESLEKTITSRAFANLKPEWRRILWYTEVEGMTPREIAPLLGMKANSIAALAYRAKEGLRVSWLQAHVNSDAADADCKWYAERLGSYNRGTLSTKVNDQVEDHLITCTKCSILVEEVDHLGRNLGLVLLPIFLGPTAIASFAVPVSTAEAVQTVPVGTHVRRLVKSNRGTIGIVAGALVAGSLIVASIAVTSSPDNPVAAPVAALPAPSQPSTTEEKPQGPAVTPPPASGVIPEVVPEPDAGTPLQEPLPAPEVEPPAILNPVPVPIPIPEPTNPPGPEVLAAPAITVVLEQEGGLFLPVVSGTGVPGAQVAISDGSKQVGAAIVGADGTWTTTPELTYGSDRPVTLSAHQAKGTLTSPQSAQSAPVTVKTPTIDSLIQESNTAILTFNGLIDKFGNFGPVGATVQILFDGVPTGNYHELTGIPLVRMIQNLTPGQHSVALRFVDRATGRHGAQITTAFYLPLPEDTPLVRGLGSESYIPPL
ncbi:sigma-70 family RNA polymerase sigma factor [Arthrobacter sp. GMC3]|uniref:sigma-70 family RNA polymerase sigma factor n=1 Tax=Arthrobacter sp. GMC3 TaxID=2058894 RepID=UPI0015E2A3C4|nr:sigma-70 family RNA polymerase sigma factor [Arthrobacter sp. GMC3]